MNHACGHDVHMAILLNLLLHVDQSKYNVNILFIFQSAEEVYAGARRLIQPLEYYSIDYLFALHVAPNLYAGYFSLSRSEERRVGKECSFLFVMECLNIKDVAER